MTLTRFTLTLAAITFTAGAALLLAKVPWLWHPLGDCPGPTPVRIRCQSYNFWSGISGSNLAMPVTCAAFALGWWHQHNCHHPGCLRLQWHVHPDHGHPVCKRHHPDDPESVGL